MFEDSLVASRVVEVSSSKRWTLLASIALQVAVAGVVMVLPLLHPEALPFRVEAPKVLMPLMVEAACAGGSGTEGAICFVIEYGGAKYDAAIDSIAVAGERY